MKILVTGCSGFIGYHLIKRLLSEDHYVTGIDNNNDYYNPALKQERLLKLNSDKFDFYNYDLNNIQLENSKFDIAINLAAQAGVRVPREKEYLYELSNVQGFKFFCNFCIKNNIKKIIYASSSSVYSDQDSGKFKESITKLQPKSKYGESKLQNEFFASDISRNNDISIIGLRFFSVYGPFGRPDMAYYSFTKSIKEDKKIDLYNNGEMYRDMTYVDDIVDGIIKSINYIFHSKKTFKNEIFNLGNDNPVKIFDLLNMIETHLGKKAQIKIIDSKNEALKTHADITKAKNLLGYRPKISLEDGIKKFISWHKNYENY